MQTVLAFYILLGCIDLNELKKDTAQTKMNLLSVANVAQRLPANKLLTSEWLKLTTSYEYFILLTYVFVESFQRGSGKRHF